MEFLRGIFSAKKSGAEGQAGVQKNGKTVDHFSAYGGQDQEENTYTASVVEKRHKMLLRATLDNYKAKPAELNTEAEAYVFQFTMSKFNLDDLMFRLEKRKADSPDEMEVKFFDSEGQLIAPPIIQEPVEELNAQYV